MRKILMICLVIITTFILLTSCSKPENLSLSEGILDNNPSLGISDDTLTNNQIGKDNEILWQADLNHDGNEEKIIVEILNNLDTGEGAKISVYNNNSDLLIYSANGDLPHAGWNGFYLYYDENGAYLMNWLPTMYQGHGNYTYDTISISKH